jgi:hypothetical protein
MDKGRSDAIFRRKCGVKHRISPESYAPVSRGLREHLSKMSGNAVKLYLELLLSAVFIGPRKGQVALSFAELALNLKMHKQTVHRAARELTPYFIDWEPAKNQHGVTVFTVQRYKAIKDFAVSRTAHSELTADKLPYEKLDQHVDSTLTAASATDTKNNGLSAPKKLKKLEKEAATAASSKKEDSAWSFLEIQPCGPTAFRTLLNSNWTSKNEQKASVVIGQTIDSWEAAHEEKLGGAAQLFRSLAQLRHREKQEAQKLSEGSEPIHVFTAEEIPA